MVQNSSILNLTGLTTDPLATKAGDQTTPPFTNDQYGCMISTELVGRFHTSNRRGHLFSANVAAVTLPVNANNLASKFSLWNPPNSGKYLDLVEANFGTVLATTVVDFVGLYYQANLTSPGGTLTAGTINSGILGNGAPSVATFYTACTHVGTPSLALVLQNFGATSDSGYGNGAYEFDGKALVPPGCVIAIAMTTAASTASGITGHLVWQEVPL